MHPLGRLHGCSAGEPIAIHCTAARPESRAPSSASRRGRRPERQPLHGGSASCPAARLASLPSWHDGAPSFTAARRAPSARPARLRSVTDVAARPLSTATRLGCRRHRRHLGRPSFCSDQRAPRPEARLLPPPMPPQPPVPLLGRRAPRPAARPLSARPERSADAAASAASASLLGSIDAAASTSLIGSVTGGCRPLLLSGGLASSHARLGSLQAAIAAQKAG